MCVCACMFACNEDTPSWIPHYLHLGARRNVTTHILRDSSIYSTIYCNCIRRRWIRDRTNEKDYDDHGKRRRRRIGEKEVASMAHTFTHTNIGRHTREEENNYIVKIYLEELSSSMICMYETMCSLHPVCMKNAFVAYPHSCYFLAFCTSSPSARTVAEYANVN